MRIRNLIAVGIGSFLVGLALMGRVDTASAAYRRVHSSQCHYSYDDAGVGLFNGAYLYTSTGRGIYCAAPSDSELQHLSTYMLNVHGYSPPATSVYSMACAKAYNTSANTCGTLKYWGSGYVGVYSVSLTAWWANAWSLPYVYSYLPAGSSLYGFYMST